VPVTIFIPYVCLFLTTLVSLLSFADNPDTAHDSQHSDNSVPLPKPQEKPTTDTSINQVEENIATTDQVCFLSHISYKKDP
jgi:hypothetical protein